MDTRYYSGTDHIFYSNSGSTVSLKAGSGQTLDIEGFVPGTVSAGVALERDVDTLNVLFDDITIGTSDNKLKVKDYSITNVLLQNSSIGVTAGSGLLGGGTVNLGASTSLAVDSTVLRTSGDQTSTGTKTFQKVNFNASADPDFSITNADGWIDINCPVTVVGSGTNDPSITSVTGLAGMQMYTFPGSGGGSSMRQCWSIIHIPHNYSPGTGVYLHAHVTTDATVLTGNYKLNFDYTYSHGGSVFPAVQTVSIVDNFTSTLQHKITEIASPILTNSLEVDGVIVVRMWRDHADVQDTFAGDVCLMFIDCHAQISKFSTKNRNKAGGSFYT